ncbi:MAG: chemotaxis protein CheA [Terriglobales bacterium]
MTESIKIDRNAILRTFAAESDEALGRMEGLLVQLEANPTDGDARDELFRIVHTLKGNASIVGLEEMVHLGHAAEDLLDALRSGSVLATRNVIDALFASLDIFRALLSGRNDVGTAEVIEQLKEACSAHVDVPLAAANITGASGLADGDSNCIRVDLEKLDAIMNLATEGAIAQARLRNALEQQGATEVLIDVQRQTEALLLQLQEEVMKLRMVPVGPLFRRFARVVRDIALEHDKQVHLEIQGEDVELDTRIFRLVRDPLTHMLRNAIDHGIEAPKARVAAGKDPCGRLTLAAYHSGGEIIVEVRDDGRGLQRERILHRAQELGLVSTGQTVTDSDVLELIFHPGFSTAQSVSDLSGRGVGMDVVRRNIEESLKGKVSVTSVESKGTTISLRVPLTLAILEGFSVEAAGEILVIPLEHVEECTELEISDAPGTHLVDLRGRVLPWVRLRDAFGIAGAKPDRESVVVVRCGDLVAGVAVDKLLGTTQAIVKPLGKVFQGVRALSGSTILGNGRVGLIVDVPGLFKSVTEGSTRIVQQQTAPVQQGQ